VDVGGGHVCARLSWGPVYCWGDNTYGQLGTGVTGVDANRTITLPSSATPIESRLSAASTISAGDKSSCAVLTDRTGWCWGENLWGELGNVRTAGDGRPNRPTRVADAGEPPPTIVSLGDSFISGEGGRWAGNTNHIEDTWKIDALGPTAYNDNDGNTAEQIPHCHRSKSAEIFIGAGVSAINLACSGAKTSSAFPDPETGWSKPGIDDADDGNGNIGQALALQRLTPERNVKLIVLSIGGNNFHFGDLVAKCVTAYLAMPKPGECRNDPAITGPGGYLSPGALSTGTAAIVGAITRIRIAMGIAGYAPGDYDIVVQNYPSVIPKADGFRYAESFWRRQDIGGCGFRNGDADFANDAVIPRINKAVNDAITVVNQDRGYNPVRLLDISDAFDGHRLCENSVNLIEQTKHASWTSPGAVDATEWVNQIRLATKAAQPPYQFEESFHPNYWGQLALRNCVRLIWNGGSVRGGKCTSTGGLNSFGEPNMSLQPI
jgi:hypothetical protein